MSPEERGAPRPLPLGVLSQRVRDARVLVHRHRQGPVNSPEVVDARRRLLEELENYVAALELRHLPVPRPLRAELELYAQLFDA